MVDIVIFVSSNAVQFALDLLELRGLSLPSGVTSAGCWSWHSPPVDGTRNCGQCRAGRVL
jgi:CRISPR/Cas system-associated exonuclease Cas4 (RecB family)